MKTKFKHPRYRKPRRRYLVLNSYDALLLNSRTVHIFSRPTSLEAPLRSAPPIVVPPPSPALEQASWRYQLRKVCTHVHIFSPFFEACARIKERLYPVAHNES